MKARRHKVSADQTKEHLIAAVIRLLDRKSAGDISCKEIAASAGVNHGLVHRYFGTKDALVREAVRRTNERIQRDHPAVGAGSWSFRLLTSHPEIPRIVARCCLDGPKDLLPLAAPNPATVDLHAGQIRAALERLGLAGIADPYAINAAGLAMFLGWVVFRPLLEAGYKIPADADEQLAAAMRLIDAIMAPGAGGG